MLKKLFKIILCKVMKSDRIRKIKLDKKIKTEGMFEMSVCYPALSVAQYIILHEAENGRPVSNLRLQKLLYFVEAYFFISTGEPCFIDRMEAWDFGPVVPDVYHKYKRFGSMIIQETDSSLAEKLGLDCQEKINVMLEQCAHKSTRELVEISHEQKPWQDAYRNPISNEITMASMRIAFSKMEYVG